MKRIFISYAKADEAFALRFARDLREAGMDNWVARLDIPPGVPWDDAVGKALKECPYFLIVLSPQSVASRNVLDEVNLARTRKNRILPVMYQECELPLQLARLQYIDFTSLGYDASLRECLGHINLLFGEPSPGTPDGLHSPTPPSSAIVRGQSKERIDTRRILWVDDNPRNNRYERKTLEELGAQVHLAVDTKSAALIAEEIPFDLFISDMGRPPDGRAGFTLLAKLRALGIEAPYLIYAGSNAEQHKAEAIRAGAIGCTNNPYDLIDSIVAALFREKDQG